MRLEAELERGRCLVPDSVVVASHDPEGISSWADVRVMRFPKPRRHPPIGIKTLELVFEPDFLRGQETERRNSKVSSPRPGGPSAYLCRVKFLFSIFPASII